MLAKLLAGLFARKGDASAAGQPARAIESYLAAHAVRKLHLGAGPRSGAQGWLATDIAPASDAIVYLDATAPFPIEDDAFDYVFSEHMIEHMSWRAGLAMLEECRRVLKPGGTLRVATPDLAVLLGLYGERDATAERYVRWITDRAMPGISAYRASFVINNAFRNWGHQFLYDAELLVEALGKAGFANTRRRAYGESGDPELRGIESHGRNIGDEQIAIFETMIFEADRPNA